MGFVANFMPFPAVLKFGKSVKILQSYRQFKGGNFFSATQCRMLAINVSLPNLTFARPSLCGPWSLAISVNPTKCRRRIGAYATTSYTLCPIKMSLLCFAITLTYRN